MFIKSSLKMGRCVQQHKTSWIKVPLFLCPASLEFSHDLLSQKVKYHAHKSVLLVVPVLMNSVHTHSVLEISFIIILPPVSIPSKRSLYFRISHLNFACISLLSHACHIPCHLIHFDFNKPIIFGKEYNQWHSSCSSP